LFHIRFCFFVFVKITRHRTVRLSALRHRGAKGLR
jgi:hypothetical protein